MEFRLGKELFGFDLDEKDKENLRNAFSVIVMFVFCFGIVFIMNHVEKQKNDNKELSNFTATVTTNVNIRLDDSEDNSFAMKSGMTLANDFAKDIYDR